MLTETPRGGVDSRTHFGVSRVVPLSMGRSSDAPGTSSKTQADRGHAPLPYRFSARIQTGLTVETHILGQATRRPTSARRKGTRHVTRP
jgi:hypothetical protein